MPRTFEDLIVWKRSREMANIIFEMCRAVDKSRVDYTLNRQITRAAISIVSNIAEGSSRRTLKDYCHFLDIANASSAEIRAQLYLFEDQKMASPELCEELRNECKVISRMIFGLQKALRKEIGEA
ncbi:four helix bundle protein [Sanyastnella coralliicola]|uniref:four helix bundle protein n=1 Tax=Sanyastnella coralliicola TaxID=3069118 RepID=UPI0027BA0166|nr:four helix bundle protein [Longitalea sp. SCSIO 12813]